jgi:hypothetical protein
MAQCKIVVELDHLCVEQEIKHRLKQDLIGQENALWHALKHPEVCRNELEALSIVDL